MVGVHVAHDNRIGDRVIMANNVLLADTSRSASGRSWAGARASTSSAGSAAWR